MPRPKLKSDDEVLAAAKRVLERRGPVDFTLSEVALEAGLSRAALIQRFSNRDTLLVRLMERSVAEVTGYLDALPRGRGPEELWAFLQALVRSMNTHYDFSVNLLISWYELQSAELRALAIQRSFAVVEAIRRRLPRGAPARAELLLHSVIAGATTQWTTNPRGELADHVLAQLAATLGLMFPKHRFRYKKGPSARSPRGRALRIRHLQ